MSSLPSLPMAGYTAGPSISSRNRWPRCDCRFGRFPGTLSSQLSLGRPNCPNALAAATTLRPTVPSSASMKTPPIPRGIASTLLLQRQARGCRCRQGAGAQEISGKDDQTPTAIRKLAPSWVKESSVVGYVQRQLEKAQKGSDPKATLLPPHEQATGGGSPSMNRAR